MINNGKDIFELISLQISHLSFKYRLKWDFLYKNLDKYYGHDYIKIILYFMHGAKTVPFIGIKKQLPITNIVTAWIRSNKRTCAYRELPVGGRQQQQTPNSPLSSLAEL